MQTFAAGSAPTPSPDAVAPFFVTGGTMPSNAASYISRRADQHLLETLRRGEFCYVLNARQMGKSSLCIRTMERLKQDGIRTVFLDLTRVGGSNLTAEQWYATLLAEMGNELGLRREFLGYFKQQSEIGPMNRFFGALKDIYLAQNESPLVVFVDEIDVTRSLPFSTDEFFAAIRGCYVERAVNPALNRLTLCLLGTASPAELIEDARITPFNIGQRIELFDFTPAEAAPLANALMPDRPTKAAILLSRILFWTGGHPYLTQILCQAVTETTTRPDTPLSTPQAIVDTLVSDLFLSHTARDSEANLTLVRDRLLRADCDQFALLSLYRQALRGKRVPDDDTNPLCDVLKLSGVVKVEQGKLRVRNEIYRRVFDEAWVEQHLPGVEIRRQKAAFRHGLGLAGALASVVLAIIGSLAFVAFRNANRADREAKRANMQTERANARTEEAERTTYIANMNLIEAKWKENNIGRVRELLEETKNFKDRGFEWGYWNRLCHLELKTLPLKGALTMNGKRYATFGAALNTLTIGDVQTGKIISTLEGKTGSFTCAGFSADNRRIATSGNDNIVRVWDVATGKEDFTLKANARVWSVALSPDSKRMVIGIGKTAKVCDTATQKELLTLSGHNNLIYSAAFSADGKRIVTGSMDKSARVWDARTGKHLLTLNGHSDIVWCCAFSVDGKHIVTGSMDASAKIWDAAMGKEEVTLRGHSNIVTCAAFSPDGKRIVTVSGDGTEKVWDAVTYREGFTAGNYGDNTVSQIAFSHDGKHLIASVLDRTARVFDATTGKEILVIRGEDRGFNCGVFSPDDKRIATGYIAKIAKVWDAITGKELLTLKGHTDEVNSIAFSPDGSRIVTGSYDATAKVWDSATGHELLTLRGHRGRVLGVTFSPDGKDMVTTGEDDIIDNTIRIWATGTGKELRQIKSNKSGGVNSVVFSPDGKRILTGNSDKTARVWDFESGKELLTLRGHKGMITSASFSPDGRRIVTSSGDFTARIWDAATGKELLSLPAHDNGAFTAVFSPDGKRLITGGNDGTVKVWFSDSDDANTLFAKKANASQ